MVAFVSRLGASIFGGIAAVAPQSNRALLHSINEKVIFIMATIADVQAHLAANESREATMIGLLLKEQQILQDTQAQLAAAIAGTDPDALQAVVDKMDADNAAMDQAIASIPTTGAIQPPTAATVSGATSDPPPAPTAAPTP